MTTTRARKAPEKAADEAQAEPIEGVVVDEEKKQADEARQQRTADMLEQLKKVLVERIRGEMNPKFEAIRGELDGLAETLAAAGPDAENFAADQLDAAVERAANKIFGREVIGPDVKTASEQLDDLRVVLAQHQADVNSRCAQLANDVGQALSGQSEALEALRTRVAAVSREGLPVVVDGSAQRVPGVYRKVHELMLAVTQIGKDRQFKAEGTGNRGGIEYSFRGIDDAMDAVGSALRTVGLIMRSKVVKAEHTVNEVPRFWKGQQEGVTLWATTRLTMRYTFIDPDDGSEHSVEGYGVGKDNGDKDGSKSSAAAMKYALFQGLCIPVKGMNIDPEEDHPTGEPTPAERQARAEEDHRDETPPPPDDTPAPEPEKALRRATAALAAARDPQKTKTQADITAILHQAAKEKILSTEVEGQTLQAWLISLRRTLGTGGQDG